MALIKKSILVCNKCGNEAEAEANMTILGEEFYLCDKCLERLINWMSLNPTEFNQKTCERFIREHEEKKVEEKPKNVFNENGIPEYVKPEQWSTYTTWDDYNIDKLLNLWGQNLPMLKCATAFKVSRNSICNIFHRIRKSTPGSDLYKYHDRLERIDLMRRGKQKEEGE